MNMKNRLRRLEAQVTPAPCCEWGHKVLIVGSRIDGDDHPGAAPDPGPVYCPSCGRQRPVLHVVEVLGTRREQAQRWIRRSAVA